MNELAIPTRYDIYMQDLTSPYINLVFMGYVRTIGEAITMCKALKEADRDFVERGIHTYIFICSRLENEQKEHCST